MRTPHVAVATLEYQITEAAATQRSRGEATCELLTILIPAPGTMHKAAVRSWTYGVKYGRPRPRGGGAQSKDWASNFTWSIRWQEMRPG